MNALVLPNHYVVHLRDKFSADVTDLMWIKALTISEEDWVVISQDKFLKGNGLERKALVNSGLVVYVLSGRGWSKLRAIEKNLAIIEWTNDLLEHAKLALNDAQQQNKGSAWEMRFKANNRKRKIIQIL